MENLLHDPLSFNAASATASSSARLPQSVSVASAPLSRGLMLEICAGSARLSLAFRTCGFSVVGLDHSYNRFEPEALVLDVDLSDSNSHHLVWAWLRHPRLLFVAMAPPCGTSTRAREIPGGPRPLRSDKHPCGIPGLSPGEQLRVDKANTIYALCIDVAKHCLNSGILFMIDNPDRSLMWSLGLFRELLTRPTVIDVCYDACMMGGTRKKAQRLRTNVAALALDD